MDVFIRRLPDSTTQLDLIQFISRALRPRWSLFSSKPAGKLMRCEILKIADSQRGTVEYHGLVNIQPPTAAVSVISQLNGSFLKEKQMEVRKFFRRSIHRDRRHWKRPHFPAHRDDQRRRDRRRPKLRIEAIHAGSATHVDRPGVSH